MKSENLNFLEPSGPLQACNGTALPLLLSAFMENKFRVTKNKVIRKIFGVKIIKKWGKNLLGLSGRLKFWDYVGLDQKTCRIFVWKTLKTFIPKNQKSLGRNCTLYVGKL